MDESLGCGMETEESFAGCNRSYLYLLLLLSFFWQNNFKMLKFEELPGPCAGAFEFTEIRAGAGGGKACSDYCADISLSLLQEERSQKARSGLCDFLSQTEQGFVWSTGNQARLRHGGPSPPLQPADGGGSPVPGPLNLRVTYFLRLHCAHLTTSPSATSTPVTWPHQDAARVSSGEERP